MTLGMFPPKLRAAGVADVVVTHIGSDQSTANSTTYTFSSKTLADDLLITVSHNEAISSVTANGVTATQVVTAGASQRASLFRVSPGASSGDIVVNLSGTGARCTIDWAGIENADSSTYDTATSTSTSAPITGSIDCEAGGAVVGFIYTFESGTPRTNSWSGITEDSDNSIEGVAQASFAHDEFAAAQSGLSVEVTPSGSVSLASLVVASFSRA